MKIASININGQQNLDKVSSFINKHNPDILALQELYQEDIHFFVSMDYQQYIYSPTSLKHYPNQRDTSMPISSQGIGLFIKNTNSFEKLESAYYHQPNKNLIMYAGNEKNFSSQNTSLISGEIKINDKKITIATTHFTWTKDGMTNENQEKNILSLLKQVESKDNLILCGDFNIPRHYNPNYEKIINSGFFDNIPKEQKTTLDINLHRLSKEIFIEQEMDKYVVDYFFTSKENLLKNISCHDSVSDHFAILAEIIL